MIISKVYSLLGIGKKAGFITYGEEGCKISIKRNKCKLLIIALDSSKNTMEKFIHLCKKNNIKYVIFGDKESLGKAIGKEIIAIISVNNLNFSREILNYIE